MENSFIRIKCKFCEKGEMFYNQSLTFYDYSLPENFVLDDITNLVDGILNEYLVYECNYCGSIEKLTYKEIEKNERHRISQLVIDSAARGEIESAINSRKPTALIYCGRCNGANGKGACPISVYKKCELKWLPNEL